MATQGVGYHTLLSCFPFVYRRERGGGDGEDALRLSARSAVRSGAIDRHVGSGRRQSRPGTMRAKGSSIRDRKAARIMKAISIAITLMSTLAWGAAASAQYGYGVPGGYFGSGGLYSGAGSPSGINNASPAYGAMPYGTGSASMFRGFTYSPYTYSSPSYGLLSPSFGGPSSSLGFGTASNLGFTVPTYTVPMDKVSRSSGPIETVTSDRERSPHFGYLTSSYGGQSSSGRVTFRSGGLLSPVDAVSFYGTGFGCSPTWRSHTRIRPW